MLKNFFKHHTIHKKIVPYLDILFILRPTLFFSIWVMVSIGMYLGGNIYINNFIWNTEFYFNTLLFFIAITLVCSSTFILNQILDIETDKANNKLFLIGNNISIIKSKRIADFLFIAGLVLGIYIDWLIFVLLVSIYIFWGYLYNKSPFILKRAPVLGWFTNSFVGILLLFIGWVYNHKIYNSYENIFAIEFIKLSIPYILAFSSVSLLTTIPDMKGDGESKVKTFPIAYGKITTIIISVLFIIPAQYISLMNEDPLASTSIIVSMPFYAFALFRQLDKDIIRAIRYPIFTLNFFVMGIYPWLFIPVTVVFYLSKYYYWHRFNIHYPTLIIEDKIIN